MKTKIPVYEAVSLIQRDAILNHLESLGIEAQGAQRDVSRKYADSSVDIAYEGYSALMGGFLIFVAEENINRAKEEIRSFLDSLPSEGRHETKKTNLEKFYSATLFGPVFPFFIPFGIYYLYQGLKNNEDRKPLIFGFSVSMTILSASLWGFILAQNHFWISAFQDF